MNKHAENCIVHVDTFGTSWRTLAILLCAVSLGACGAGTPTNELIDAPEPVDENTIQPSTASQNTNTELGNVETVELGAATPIEEAQNGTIDTVDATVTQTVNQAPNIEDTSYNCDPVVESVAFSVGQSDSFTLSVTDEFPLALSYAADSSSEEIVDISVDEDGIFTIVALQAGESWVWLSAEDADGLADEYELHVTVQ